MIQSIGVYKYGGIRTFDTEEEAKEFARLFDGPEYGIVRVFYQEDKWYVTQYIRSPFPLQVKEEGMRFKEFLI